MTAAATAKERSPPQYRTLVLNADGRPLSSWPLSLIPAEAAVHAICRDRAVAIEEWDAVYRSPTRSIPIPKTILLRHYAPVSSSPKFCRRSVLLRDRYSCQYCGEKFPSHELTFDHVVPRSKGGSTTWDNILMACIACNARKRDHDPNYSGQRGKEGSLRPLKTPRRPTSAELLRAGMEFLPNDIRESWSDYLYWTAPLER